MDRRRGRPVLGGIGGLVGGLGAAVLLQQGGVWPLDRLTLFGLPIVLAILGVLWAYWAPLGRRG